MDDKDLYDKYKVSRVDGSDCPGGKHHGCEYFVIDLTHDENAFDALLGYAFACSKTRPNLSRQLIEKAKSIDAARREGGEGKE